ASVALIGGCGASPHRDVVSRAAVSFVTDIEHHDDSGACRLLTDTARTSASGATNLSCDRALAFVHESGSRISGLQVWGDTAQVHVGSDVLFLRRFPDAWLVSAAGCRPQQDGPYDCLVGG
ncbi:MAG: hypothetical protein QOH17_3195, partial [Pseudonocardiales bacterium]|nr:hypothetical protein [Pseudonocardiales bacterium]